MQIAIFGNTEKNIVPHIEEILNFFKEKKVDFLFEKKLFKIVNEKLHLKNSDIEIIEDENFSADLAISIGGDGTFLNTASYIRAKGIPIMGINVGRLGFLTDVSTKEIKAALISILEKEYEIEDRSLLHAEVSNGANIGYPFALNELAVQKQEISSMIVVHTCINGEPIHSYQADGLIVATPTGSTAYSMSVGGPIVVPQAESFIVSPISSHSLNVRPLIIPDKWEIELAIESRTKSFLFALDGRSETLRQSTKIKIKKADYTIKVIKRKNHSFFKTLREKLLWGKDLRI